MEGYRFRKRGRGGWEFIEFPQTADPIFTTWVPSREIEVVGRSDGLLIPTRWPTFITTETGGERLAERQAQEERQLKEAEQELEQSRELQRRDAPKRKSTGKGASGDSSTKKRKG